MLRVWEFLVKGVEFMVQDVSSRVRGFGIELRVNSPGCEETKFG